MLVAGMMRKKFPAVKSGFARPAAFAAGLFRGRRDAGGNHLVAQACTLNF
jgi:hypothetical protein